MMTPTNDKYLPALGWHWLTPLYDPLMKWGMREAFFKERLIAQAQICAGQRVFDLGCGTGTLTLMLKQRYPTAKVVGLDADPQVLAIARSKTAQAKLEITWDHGLAYQLPYPAESFDRVLTSLMVHHLTSENKLRAFREVHRVLKPGGELHIADWGPPHSPAMRLLASVIRRVEETRDNLAGRLPAMLTEAGFQPVTETEHLATIIWSLSLYRAVRPIASGGKQE